MTSRERVLTTIEHREPDCIPIDFGGTFVSGMHITCVAALRDYYGLESHPVKLIDPHQVIGLIEPDLQQAMGVDVEGMVSRKTIFGYTNEGWKPWSLHGRLDVLVPADFNITTEVGGDILIYPEGDTSAPPSGRMPKDGFYFDSIIRQEPIDEAALDPEDNLEEYGPISDEDLDWLENQLQYARTTGRAVAGKVGGTSMGDIAWLPAPYLKHPKGIRDISEWYISVLTRPDYIHQVFSRQTEIALANLETIASRMGDKLDIITLCGADFGTQDSTFFSVETFRDLWLPYYKKINDWIHANTEWKIFKHSCGSVETYMEAFIDAGFDIINPVQCSAANMEPSALKDRYGDRITFWGGGVDTQQTLPFGTPEEVRAQVLRHCEIFAPGGGFIFNAVHNVQANTPVANMIAMLNAVHEFNGRK